MRLPAARELLASLNHSLKAEQAKFEEISAKQAKKQEKADELEEGSWCVSWFYERILEFSPLTRLF